MSIKTTFRLSQFLLLLCLSASAQKQVVDTITVLSAAGKIKPSVNRYIQYTETKAGLIYFNSILTRKLESTQLNGTPCHVISQTYQLNNAIDIDSSFFDGKNMLPLAYRTAVRSEACSESVSFLSAQIENTVRLKDSSYTYSKPNKGYYNGVMLEELIKTLPLADKKIFYIKLVIPGQRFSEYATKITVDGKENITVPGIGVLSCWRLLEDNGAVNITWYTVREKTQVRSKFVMGNGNVFYRLLLVS
jgi:hypothetical protein